MCVFSSPSFDHHELVSFSHDPQTGLKAIIAVHNSNLGPAVGGCRMFPYDSDAQALEDVLRLSRGMTYKSALAGLPMGGGKAVIIGDHRSLKTPELLRAMGDFIESQGGKYITAEDSGTCVEDMKVMRERTSFVSGVDDNHSHGGDPSPYTAYGIYCGMKAAIKYKLNSDSLQDIKVAVQGAGAVGRYLCELLIRDGAHVFVADINDDNLNRTKEMGAHVVDVNSILDVDVDVFAPCAMGAVLNDETIPQLKAKIIAGGANNQLMNQRHGQALLEAGVLYAPDFVINAGGIIEIHHQRAGTAAKSKEHIAKIGQTLTEIFELSELNKVSTVKIAEQLAETIFQTDANKLSAAYANSNNA